MEKLNLIGWKSRELELKNIFMKACKRVGNGQNQIFPSL